MEGGVTIASILESVGSIVTSAASWVGTWAGELAENPLLLMFAIIPVVGLGVGLLRRLLSVN